MSPTQLASPHDRISIVVIGTALVVSPSLQFVTRDSILCGVPLNPTMFQVFIFFKSSASDPKTAVNHQDIGIEKTTRTDC